MSFLPKALLLGILAISGTCTSLQSAVLLNDAEIVALQSRLNASEPRATSYFEALDFAAATWRKDTPQAPAQFQVPRFYLNKEAHRDQKARLLHDATAAYGLALHYRLDGDNADAAHAVRFLRPWFRDVTYVKDAETSLVVSYTFPLMIFAADLLRTAPLSIWTQEDRDGFDTLLAGTILELNTADRPNNWGNWGNVLCISIATYRDDKALFKKAIARHKEFIGEQIDANNAFIHEVTRNNGVGEQGISYSHFTLGPLALTAQIALGHNVDLFNYVAPNGRSLEPAWRQLVAWTAAPETFPYFKGSDLSKMENVTTTNFDFFDRARTGLFPIRMGYFELLQARWPEPAANEILSKIGSHGLDPTGTQWLGLTHSAPCTAPIL